MGNQEQSKPEARPARFQVGATGKAKDLVPDSNCTSSILLNADDMTLASEGDGYKGFD